MSQISPGYQQFGAIGTQPVPVTLTGDQIAALLMAIGYVLRLSPDGASIGSALAAAGFVLPTGPTVPTTRNVSAIDSITGGGDLSADRTLSLVNDVVTPTNGQFYGYQTGARGWSVPTNVTSSAPGYAPTGPNDPTKFLDGTSPPSWAVPPSVAATTPGYVPSPASAAEQVLRTNSSGVPAWRKEIVINVVDYGADPTGVSDSTTAITNAVAFGRSVYFPTGTYKVSSAITLNNPGTYFGDGCMSSTLSTSSATADIFVIASVGIEICRLGFVSSVTRTGGFYINTSGTTVYERVFVHHFYMTGCYYGIHGNFNNGGINDGYIYNPVAGTGSVGIFIDQGGFENMSVTRVVMYASPSAGYGIYVTYAPALHITECEIYQFGSCIAIIPAAGSTNGPLYIDNCFLDQNGVTGANVCIYVNVNVSGISLNDLKITNCWLASGLQNGISLQASGGGTLNGVQIIGCSIFHNKTQGLYANLNVNNLRILDSYINSNGWGGSYAGIFIDSASNFSIINNRIGSAFGLGGNTAEGIYVNTSAQNFHIVNNVIVSNGTYGVTFAGSNTYCIVMGNMWGGNASGATNGAPTGTFVLTNNI